MVYGLEKFKEYFKDSGSQYVFIGGTACDIILNEIGAPFRATKDLDIVLIIEALDVSFGEVFWKFIEDGGYEHREKGSKENQFYRFMNPKQSEYPKMIELFSRKSDNLNLKVDNRFMPIHIEESIISLSAILLNDEYYNILVNAKYIIDDYSVINIEALILFKIKAWLDLNERKEKGESIDSKNITKHKNDIFRLLANVIPSSKMKITDEIKKDIEIFIEKIKEDKPDLKNLRLGDTSFEELMEIITNIYMKTV
jgi:hypothetical protein